MRTQKSSQGSPLHIPRAREPNIVPVLIGMGCVLFVIFAAIYLAFP